MEDIIYQQKYLKYKKKYLDLKSQVESSGGGQQLPVWKFNAYEIPGGQEPLTWKEIDKEKKVYFPKQKQLVVLLIFNSDTRKHQASVSDGGEGRRGKDWCRSLYIQINNKTPQEVKSWNGAPPASIWPNRLLKDINSALKWETVFTVKVYKESKFNSIGIERSNSNRGEVVYRLHYGGFLGIGNAKPKSREESTLGTMLHKHQNLICKFER